MTDALKQGNDLDNISADPKLAIMEAVDAMGVPEDAKLPLRTYLDDLTSEDAEPKAEIHQIRMEPIMQQLIESGEKEKAGLLFNFHRIMTDFRGYSPNYKPDEEISVDADQCFDPKCEIPPTGLIVIDRFAVRNLHTILARCDEQGVERDRIRVRVPKLLLAAQMHLMKGERKENFERAMGLLPQKCFLVDDKNHSHDIPLDGDIGVLCSPRTLPIMPSMDGGNEEETIKNYQAHIRQIMEQTVPGGRLLINIAVVKTGYESLNARIEEGKKRNLAKICNQATKGFEEMILAEFRSAGWQMIRGENIGAIPEYDHEKEILELHVQKPMAS